MINSLCVLKAQKLKTSFPEIKEQFKKRSRHRRCSIEEGILKIKKFLKIVTEEKSSEAAVRRCSAKYVFLKISQYLQENTFVEISTLLERDSNTGIPL